MTLATSTWLSAYLEALAAHPQFVQAQSVLPLWLAREGAAEVADYAGMTPTASRITIQMAAELFPRMALVGPAGAGKTTLLRQLAGGLAEAHRTAARDGGGRSEAGLPIPLYVEMARFAGDIPATLERTFGVGAPALADLAHDRPLLFLLDGLDELAPDAQLAGLASASATLSALGTQARWIASCRSEHLPLFRPWLGAAEVRSIRPLQPREVIATVERQRGKDLADWLRRTDDLVSLATRPRWLAALLAATDAARLRLPYARGRLLTDWIAAVVAATLEIHPQPVTAEAIFQALPVLAQTIEQRHDEPLSFGAAAAALLDHAGDADPRATLQLLTDAGILSSTTDRSGVDFRHPALRAFGQALMLAHGDPAGWPAAIFTRAWSDAVVLSYSLADDHEAVLRRLLASDAVRLTARCLIDAEPPERFEPLLARSGTLTPPLRVLLADAFAAEGLTAIALEQLERAGTEGYDEAGLFGRLGELYSDLGQWRHARAAFEQALAREPGDLRYRQRFGIVCSRLGEMDQAAAALRAVVEAERQRLAEAAHELGHVYMEQNKLEPALEAYEQAVASQPAEPSYRRSVAGALRRRGRYAEAGSILRELIAEDSGDALAQAELGQVYADAGQIAEAIACFTKAVALRPSDSRFYAQIGRLRQAQGDMHGARAALQRAAELDSTDVAIYCALGQVCEQCGEIEAALAAYRHAIRLNDGDERPYRRLGALLRDRGDDEGAAEALRMALRIGPASAETHAELAALLWRQQQYDDAIASYQRALALAPASADIHHAIGMAYRSLGRNQAAAPYLYRAVDLDPRRADLHYDAGALAEGQEQWESALASYERAAELEPRQPLYARTAGALQLRLGRRARARQLLAAALRLDRRATATLHQIGLLHLAEQRWPRAIRALRRAAHTGRAPHCYDQLGRALAQVGRLDEACAAFKQALLIEPDRAETLHHYSLALAASGQVEPAYDAARRAARLASGDATVQQHAGSLALKLGRRQEALALLDQSVALDSAQGAAHLERGRLLLDLDQPQAALTAARAALDQAPSLAPAALVAGLALVRLSRPDAAREMFDRAVALDEKLVDAHAARRDLLAAAGEVDAACDAARLAVELAPSEASHALRFGELLLAVGALPEATEAFERTVQLEPGCVAAHARLSESYARQEDWRQARVHAERAVALAPDIPEHHVLQAGALAGTGDLPAACRALAVAADRAPDRADWQFELGQLHRRAGDQARALPRLRRAALIAPDRAEHHYALGECLAALGEPGAAIEAIERALRLRPEAASWRAQLAELQLRRGWHGEALAEINRAIAGAPELAALWRLRAEAEIQVGQTDAAQADLVETLRRDPRDGRAFALLARLLLQLGRAPMALDAARRAIRLQPDDAELRSLLASVLRALGQRAEAAEQLQRALGPDAPAAWWADLAGDYEASGQLERARAAWERALALAPSDASARYHYGSLLAKAGDLPAAQEQLRLAIAAHPGLAAAHAQLAEVSLALTPEATAEVSPAGNQLAATAKSAAVGEAEALQSARRAVALQPQHADHWRILGTTLRRHGMHDEAVQAFRRAHELAPDDARPAFLLGLATLDGGDLAGAVAAFQAAAQCAPETAIYHAYLGVASRRAVALPDEPDELGNLDAAAAPAIEQARAALARATELDPDDARWHYELALAEQLLGRHDQAIAALDRCVTLVGTDEPRAIPQAGEPSLADIYGRRARSRYLAGQLDAARADQEAALARRPDDLPGVYLLGRIAYQQGDLAIACTRLAEAATRDRSNGRAQLYLGRALLDARQPAEALAALERAAELHPNHAATAALLSDAYAMRGRHERAIGAAARAVRLDPSVAEHHQRLAALYASAGRLNDARATLINALALRPDVADWHVQMGEICLRLGMHDAGRSSLMRAVQLAPEEIGYRYKLAQLLASQGRAAEAKSALSELVQRAPDRGAWRYELGRLHQQLGEDEAALQEFAAALHYAPDVAAHWSALGALQRRMGSMDTALETIERALARFGDDPALHLAAGGLHEQQASHDLAAWHYAAAVERDPANAEHWWRLGRARLALDDRAGARAALEQAIQRDAHAAPAHGALARILIEDGDDQAALVHGKRAAELAPDDAYNHAQHAAILARLRRYDESHDALSRAVALAPGDPEILSLYGEMALNIGLERQALEAFERAIKLRPDEARYYYLAGRAHRRLKHYSRAIEQFRRAVRLQPNYSDAVRELSTLGPLAFVSQYLRGSDSEAAA